MHPAYFDVRFDFADHWIAPCDTFAIITAYQTTGQTWAPETNAAADETLRQTLCGRSLWHRRLTGYSPLTGHAEPGWAVGVDFHRACDLGLVFRQDAIYYVEWDKLFVSHCDERRNKVEVGSFRERLRQRRKGPIE